MLRRLAAGGALVATAALMLAGCSPPEPALADAEVVSEATATINEFYQVVDAQFENRSASSDAFARVAADGLALSYSAEIQNQIDEGTSSRGVPEVSDVELVERGDSDFTVHFCTDASRVRTTTPAGPIPGRVVAWSAEFVPLEGHDGLIMSALDVRGDETACGQ